MTTTIDISEPSAQPVSEDALYELNQFGFLVRKRPPGNITVTTNVLVNQMKEELGV